MINFARPIFRDRRDAGERLATALLDYVDQSALVLGLARGGVIVAAEVAAHLNADLDVLVVHKLGAPQSEELAIGVVTSQGGLYLNDEIIRWLEVRPEYVKSEGARQQALAAQREFRYRQNRPMPDMTGRPVILVDDGLATGASMVAALRDVNERGPELVVVAVPVGAPGSCGELHGQVNDVVCLHQPEPFWAVGMFYLDFSEVSDDEVMQALQPRRERVP
jgi:putative phosphoribosyl transferase